MPAISKFARRVLQGEPLIIVQDGKLIDRNLNEERLTLDDVMEEYAATEIERLDEIKFAVVEASGAMSFLKN